MLASARVIALLRDLEGLALVPYRDGKGWSVGYGHWSEKRPGSVTQIEAERMLADDASAAVLAVTSLVRVVLNDDERDALTLLVFNIGSGNFADSTLLKKLNAGDRAGAAAEFDVWRMSGGEVLPGLVRRRAQERALFEGKKSMGNLQGRIKEPSTWAGLGVVMTAIGQLIASGGVDPTAWVAVLGGIFAIWKREAVAAS